MLCGLGALVAERIGKGNARQPYEFGVKVHGAVPHQHGLMAGVRSTSAAARRPSPGCVNPGEHKPATGPRDDAHHRHYGHAEMRHGQRRAADEEGPARQVQVAHAQTLNSAEKALCHRAANRPHQNYLSTVPMLTQGPPVRRYPPAAADNRRVSAEQSFCSLERAGGVSGGEGNADASITRRRVATGSMRLWGVDKSRRRVGI